MQNLDWQKCKLDQLGFVGRGKSKHRPRNDPSLYGGKYPFFQTGDIKAARLHLTEFSQTYNAKGLAQSKLWEEGTLCITIAANIADTAILGLSGCFPDSVVGFTADPTKADTRFIKYYIDTLKLQMQGISRGTTQDNLSLDKLLTFDIRTPPLPLQIQIADILSSYDDLIENNLKRIKILEEMARLVYREWFVNFRFPGHEQIPLMETSIGKIPKGWVIGKVADFIDLKSGYAFKSKTFSKEGQYPLLTIRNVQDGYFEPTSDSRIDAPPSNMPGHCLVDDGDILLSLTGNVGRACLVYGGPYLLNQRVAKVVPVRSSDTAFAYLFIRDNQIREKLERLANGVAQQNLSPVMAMQLPCAIPPVDIRDFFNVNVAPMLKSIVTLYLCARNLGRTRDLLLPRLISGQLDLSQMEKPTQS